MICENAEAMLKPHYTQQQWEVFITYYSLEEMTEKIKTQAIFCATWNNEIVGTIALTDDFVVGFYTHLSHLNKGIGSKLMKHLEEFALTRNLQEIQLAASPVGLRFYYKNGWEKIKDYILTYFGVGFEETLMVKKLR